jgi:uroporphyrinogen decarboxylase
LVHKVLEKASTFIAAYASALKRTGADGIIMAEPLAGLLSPQLIEEFSTQYVRKIVSELQDKHFIVIYHNCGSAVPFLLNSILDTGCYAFHFGDSVDMRSILERVPRNYLVMGNISPAKVFNKGTTEQMRLETLKLLKSCGRFNNFLISSGCDLPPDVDLDNVAAFFETTEGFYYRQSLWNTVS